MNIRKRKASAESEPGAEATSSELNLANGSMNHYSKRPAETDLDARFTYDADHAFFNDTRPEVYDPEAAADAWRRVLELFMRLLAIAVPTGA